MLVNENSASDALQTAPGASISHPGIITDALTDEDIDQGLGIRFSLNCPHGGTSESAKTLLTDMLTLGTPMNCCLCPPGHGPITRKLPKGCFFSRIINRNTSCAPPHKESKRVL